MQKVKPQKTVDKKRSLPNKKFSKNKKIAPKKPDSTKIIVNLTRKSQNWKSIAEDITKKQTLYRKKLGPNHPKNKNIEPADRVPTEAAQKPEIWFDVDSIYLPEAEKTSQKSEFAAKNNVNGSGEPPPKTLPNHVGAKEGAKVTKVIGIDCEMVGVGENGKDSILARVSLVNQYGECVYDKFVIPTEKITDFRTSVSGVRPDDLKKENGAVEFAKAQREVSEVIEGKVLVGHAIHNDLQVLFLSHPKKNVRDTQKCKVFKQIMPSLGGLSSLKKLAKGLLGIDIQEGEHNSVHDAQATMRIYTTYRKEWEAFLRNQKVSKKELASAQSLNAATLGGEEDEIGKDVKGSENHKRYIKNKLKKRLNRKLIK